MASIQGKAQPLFTRRLPKDRTGARGLIATFALTAVTTQTLIVNLTEAGVDFINGVFIDNSQNASAFTLYNPVTGQISYCPAYSQASLALITAQGNDNQQYVGSSAGGVDVKVIFRNTEPLSDIIWSVLAPGAVAGAITVQGQVTTIPYVSAGTDGTGIIALGGASQLLFAANAARKSLIISNPASGPSQGIAGAPESLFICFGSTATLGGAKMFEIAPGGYFNPLGATDNRSINIIAATTNHVFAAIQY